jgi:LPXTG-motif cell wall-anchored protein
VGAALALVSAPFLTATASVAATDQNVLVFVNDAVSDTSTGQEVDQTIAALTADDSTVTTFDGGDGSASAWTTALAEIEVLVFPDAEMGGRYYEPGGTPWMSDEALAVISAWVEAGGDIVVMGTWGSDVAGILFTALSGLDFASVWSVIDGGTPLQLVATDDTLPAELQYADGTYPVVDFVSWPSDLTETLTPLYLTADGTGLGVGRWTLGAGSYSYNAWDYYPWFGGEIDEEDEPNVAAWYAVLSGLLALAIDPVVEPEPEPEPAAAPELAETGDDSVALGVAGIALLASGIGLSFVRRRIRMVDTV